KNVAALDLNELFNILIPVMEVTPDISGFFSRIVSVTRSTKACVRKVEEPSGRDAPIINTPASSFGIKPDGFAENKPKVPTKIHTRTTITNGVFFKHHFTLLEYLLVTLANQALNLKKNLFNPFASLFSFEGFNSIAHNAGVN